MSNQTIIVDDTDLKQIVYSNGWATGDSSSEYNGTVHACPTFGCTVTFTFNGTSVSVYGTVPVTNSDPLVPESTYKLDSASAVTYTSPSVKTEQYHQLFFQSPELANEQHTLVVTTVKANTAFLLDYFAYTVPTADSPSGATALSSALPTATSSASQSSQSSRPNGGVLAACILAPICVLLLAALGFLWWRKRVLYSRKGKHVKLSDEDPRPFPISPFSPALFASGPSVPPPAYTPSADDADPFASHYVPSAPPSPSASAHVGKSTVQFMVANSRPATQHTDGGVRLEGSSASGEEKSADLTELPPAYGRYS